MADRDALLALAERVEGLAGPDREVDWLCHREREKRLIDDITLTGFRDRDGRWLTYRYPHRWPWSLIMTPRYTASLAATVLLVPKETDWGIAYFGSKGNEAQIWPCGDYHSPHLVAGSSGISPALALTAACLRARAAAIGSGEGA